MLTLNNAGKRFNREWIFRNLQYSFETPGCYAITGPNGSGKSTLLQLIAGAIMPSEGTIDYSVKVNGDVMAVKAENVYRHIAIAAPYVEVVEEMTAIEFLTFHTSFKPLFPNIDFNEILAITGLTNAVHKQIRFFSSGMKQRIKLAQAIFSEVPLILLDEPCTNLDTGGYDLYYRLIEDYCKDKLVIISSNDLAEYNFCTAQLNITDWK